MAKRKTKSSAEKPAHPNNNNNSVTDYREAAKRVLGPGADAIEEEYQQMKKEKKLAKAIPEIAREQGDETEQKE